MKTYSFKDLSGAFTHPLAGFFPFSGQIGMNQVTIAMATEKTAHDVAADSTVLISAIAGDNGTITVEVQQTSALHTFFMAWYNIIKTALQQGDATNWATGNLTLRNLVDKSLHVASGVSPMKMADKPYASQGQRVTWTLMCGDIQTTTLG